MSCCCIISNMFLSAGLRIVLKNLPLWDLLIYDASKKLLSRSIRDTWFFIIWVLILFELWSFYRIKSNSSRLNCLSSFFSSMKYSWTIYLKAIWFMSRWSDWKHLLSFLMKSNLLILVLNSSDIIFSLFEVTCSIILQQLLRSCCQFFNYLNFSSLLMSKNINCADNSIRKHCNLSMIFGSCACSSLSSLLIRVSSFSIVWYKSLILSGRYCSISAWYYSVRAHKGINFMQIGFIIIINVCITLWRSNRSAMSSHQVVLSKKFIICLNVLSWMNS